MSREAFKREVGGAVAEILAFAKQDSLGRSVLRIIQTMAGDPSQLAAEYVDKHPEEARETLLKVRERIDRALEAYGRP